MPEKLISVVTTFRNEAPTLRHFIQRVTDALEALPQYRHEIVFVDDDSTDGSLEILKSIAREDDRVKIVVTSRRFGVYPCLIAGLRHARGDAVIYLETDLQDPPELIPELVREWENEADVVYTTRKERLGESKTKLLITEFAYKTINRASCIPIPINSGDYKLLARRAVDHVLAIEEDDPYFRGMVSWVGFNQKQVLYVREGRFHGESRRSLFSLAPLQVFLSGLLGFSNMPLYFSAAAGLASASALPLVAFWAWLHDTWMPLGIFLVILAVVTQLSVGIQSLYLVRVLAGVRKRPLYLVRETIGFDQDEAPFSPRAATGDHGVPIAPKVGTKFTHAGMVPRQ